MIGRWPWFIVYLHSGEARLLSLFSILRFPNSECVGSDGVAGECYTATECAARAGTRWALIGGDPVT